MAVLYPRQALEIMSSASKAMSNGSSRRVWQEILVSDSLISVEIHKTWRSANKILIAGWQDISLKYGVYGAAFILFNS